MKAEGNHCYSVVVNGLSRMIGKEVQRPAWGQLWFIKGAIINRAGISNNMEGELRRDKER
jgi:hypothetical protein